MKLPSPSLGSGARSVSENANVNSRRFGSSPATVRSASDRSKPPQPKEEQTREGLPMKIHLWTEIHPKTILRERGFRLVFVLCSRDSVASTLHSKMDKTTHSDRVLY